MATRLYRVGAIVFVLFALGHTYGFLSLRPPSDQARGVYVAMNAVQFAVHGRSYTYGGFYRGLGLSCTAAMILQVFFCWHLGNLARSNPAAIGILGWAFFAVQMSGVVLSYLYFGPPAMAFSALAAVILGLAAWLT